MMQAKFNPCMSACMRHKLLSKGHSRGGVVMLAVCSLPGGAQVSFN